MDAIDVVETESQVHSAAVSLANLKPWVKGQSGNPGGMPGGPSRNPAWYVERLPIERDKLQAIADSDDNVPKANAAQWVLDGGDKDSMTRGRARDSICDRIEGKPIQKVLVAEVGAGSLSKDELFAQLDQRLGVVPSIKSAAATCDHATCSTAYCPHCGEPPTANSPKLKAPGKPKARRKRKKSKRKEKP